LYLFTYGSPRVGNEQFAKYTNDLLTPKKIFRVTYGKDPVPMVPPANLGFLHVGDGAYFFTDLKTFTKLQVPDEKKNIVLALALKQISVSDHKIYKEI